jgi:hypothetical protein
VPTKENRENKRRKKKRKCVRQENENKMRLPETTGVYWLEILTLHHCIVQITMRTINNTSRTNCLTSTKNAYHETSTRLQ